MPVYGVSNISSKPDPSKRFSGEFTTRDEVNEYNFPFKFIDSSRQEFWDDLRSYFYEFDEEKEIWINKITTEYDAFDAFWEYMKAHSDTAADSLHNISEEEGEPNWGHDGSLSIHCDPNDDAAEAEMRAVFSKYLVMLAFTHQALFYIGSRDINYSSDLQGVRLGSPASISIFPEPVRVPFDNVSRGDIKVTDPRVNDSDKQNLKDNRYIFWM